MRRYFAFCFGFMLLLAGCGEKSSQSPQAAGTNTTSSGGDLATAPVEYLRTATKSQQDANKVVDVAALDKAISLFNVDKGRNPKDLDELVQEKYIPKIPPTPFGTKLSYDSNSGKVSVEKQ